ncbi:hypothetical protein Rsub_07557 [Raphidocelis subcapitata]|uniref:Uncharacterized protein n=1 Tax=Raphidocelis subcapitata TaxID=307507 RepID=A0A2V0P5C7_9CHLO|nr:hypothetical protein Rsub_07557 [Raphidocelis subcapitata]|eukprot:GBF95056.1 hypothetical protein Rsub_07557 [Raphidocelis subcapitata]
MEPRERAILLLGGALLAASGRRAGPLRAAVAAAAAALVRPPGPLPAINAVLEAAHRLGLRPMFVIECFFDCSPSPALSACWAAAAAAAAFAAPVPLLWALAAALGALHAAALPIAPLEAAAAGAALALAAVLGWRRRRRAARAPGWRVGVAVVAAGSPSEGSSWPAAPDAADEAAQSGGGGGGGGGGCIGPLRIYEAASGRLFKTCASLHDAPARALSVPCCALSAPLDGARLERWAVPLKAADARGFEGVLFELHTRADGADGGGAASSSGGSHGAEVGAAKGEGLAALGGGDGNTPQPPLVEWAFDAVRGELFAGTPAAAAALAAAGGCPLAGARGGGPGCDVAPLAPLLASPGGAALARRLAFGCVAGWAGSGGGGGGGLCLIDPSSGDVVAPRALRLSDLATTHAPALRRWVDAAAARRPWLRALVANGGGG